MGRTAVGALQIHTTRYSRGAVVKLCPSPLHHAVAKFVIEAKRGRVWCRHFGEGSQHKATPAFPDLSEHISQDVAIEWAERECERIRLTLGGPDVG